MSNKEIDTYLYVIGWDANGPVKIGYTTDPERRLAQLQTAQPNPLQIFHTREVEAERARLMEGLVHKVNRRHKINGEWYNLSVDDAIAEIEMAFIQWGDKPLNKHNVKNLKIY